MHQFSAPRPISDGIRGTQDKWVRLESKLLAVEKLLEVFEKRLTLVEGHLQEIRTLQDALPDTLSRIFFKIPPDFERIGSRYFYIEHERKTLTEAVNSCRKKGGDLASLDKNDLPTFDAIKEKLREHNAYLIWIINNETKRKDNAYIAINKFSIGLRSGYIELDSMLCSICEAEQKT